MNLSAWAPEISGRGAAGDLPVFAKPNTTTQLNTHTLKIWQKKKIKKFLILKF